MLDIAICDEELSNLNSLEQSIVTVLFDENELNIDLYDNGDEFAEMINNKRSAYDMIFLSTQLENNSGLLLASQLRKYDLKCEIVFISDDPSGVFEAFDYNPFDYLLNPVSFESVKSLFDRYRYYHNSNTEEYFSFRSGGIEDKVKINSIIYFYSNGRKLTIVTEQRKLEFYSKLDDVEELLEENNFIRIHQSYLVNPRHIKYIIINDVVMENDEYLPISRNRHKSVMEKYVEIIG